MANIKYDYNETWESRIEGVRKDGPSIYTSLLEKIDNSIDWGKADKIDLNFDTDRMNLSLNDNGANGFGTVESCHRYFKLGGRNDNVTYETIGKYGKGGYRADMNIGDDVFIETNFDDKTYSIGTDFIDMIRDNTEIPTIPIHSIINKNKKIGSNIKIKIRPEYHITFRAETLIRNITRGYHLTENLTIVFDKKEYKPCDHCPYEDHLMKKDFSICYDRNDNIFISNLLITDDGDSDSDSGSDYEEVNNFSIGTLTYYVLKSMITNNPYLGDSPGIDFYRNGRMCNTHNPLQHIGHIGENLSKGQMRGKRCHMTFNYNNHQLTDKLDVDDCLGLTTNKEVTEDTAKFNEGLLEILEEKALECNNSYEKMWSEKKRDHQDSIKKTLNHLNKLDKYEDAKLYNDKENIMEIHDKYQSFLQFKHWKISEEDLSYYYYKTKKEIKTAKDNGEDCEMQRANWPPFADVERICHTANAIINRKKKYSKYHKQINTKKDKLGIDYEIAKVIVDTEEYISELYGNKETDIENENYSDASIICQKIILKIKENNIGDYFENILEYLANEIVNLNKKEEEKERIRLEQEKECIKKECIRLEQEEEGEEEKERIRLEQEEEKERIRLEQEEEEERIRLEQEEEEERIRLEEKEGMDGEKPEPGDWVCDCGCNGGGICIRLVESSVPVCPLTVTTRDKWLKWIMIELSQKEKEELYNDSRLNEVKKIGL